MPYFLIMASTSVCWSTAAVRRVHGQQWAHPHSCGLRSALATHTSHAPESAVMSFTSATNTFRPWIVPPSRTFPNRRRMESARSPSGNRESTWWKEEAAVAHNTSWRKSRVLTVSSKFVLLSTTLCSKEAYTLDALRYQNCVETQRTCGEVDVWETAKASTKQQRGEDGQRGYPACLIPMHSPYPSPTPWIGWPSKGLISFQRKYQARQQA